MRDAAARWHPSPNCGARRDGARPDMVVLHYTAMDETCAARNWLCAPKSEVSAHYLISTTGDLFQMVVEDQRAWHAGAGRWGMVADVNSRSVGIELTNPGDQPFAEPQMAALETLLRRIMSRWAITPRRVIGHSDMAPGRKQDPGRRFDWRRLALRGLSIWPEARDAAAPDMAQFRALAVRVGYTADAENDVLLDALRQRFCPWATGPLSAQDMGIVADLAHRFPVDAGDPSA